jgi:hypothetical protein
MLEYDWEVVFKHSYREANHMTDALAKHRFLVKDKRCFFQVCPGHCRHLLDSDENGITTPRSVSL